MEKFRSGIDKIRIRDKHPGSATRNGTSMVEEIPKKNAFE
jgi:hypothetical protein